MLIGCKQIRIPDTLLNTHGYSYQLFNSISQIEDLWNSLIPFDEYWQSDYHLALEKSLPKDLIPFYVIIYYQEIPIGVVYLQWKKVNLKDSIRVDGSGIINGIKKFFLSFLKNNTLVVGNLLLTGKYGFHFKNDVLLETQFDIVNQIAECVCNDLISKVRFGTILIKDFFEENLNPNSTFSGYTKFSVQPNMMMDTRSTWKSVNDYCEDLKSKARIRYRRTLNKLHPLSSRELTFEEVEENKQRFIKLYYTIANNASFNLFYLQEDYFPNLKKYLKDKIKVIGYFNEEQKLLGFYTIVKNYDHLDAHFLGYDASANKENLLYLNMLFDMVSQGINLRVHRICMSRTAVEIKSSVGARPLKMYCYLKHRNRLLNKIVPISINYLYKDEQWIERNPFK